MSEDKKIVSFKTIDDNMPKHFNDYTSISFGGVDIEVKHYLSLFETMKFVKEVTGRCFLGDNEEYVPDVKDFLTSSCIIQYYTNIVLPDDAEERYDFIMKCGELIDVILGHIDSRQFDSIIDAIDDKIDYINSQRIAEINKQINSIYSVIDNLGEQFKDIFNGVEPGDLKSFVGAINTDGIDASKLVSALASTMKDMGHESVES